jgi:RNA polymerase sigma factor (sigma-70 family)
VESHQAEDLAQEALLRIWSRIGTLRRADRLESWAFSIALNTLRSHARGRTIHDALPQDLPQATACPLRHMIRSELLDWVEGEVRCLTPSARETVRLRIVQGLSAEGASRSLGISRARLRHRLHRALMRLRERARTRFGEEDLEASRATLAGPEAVRSVT